MIQGPKENLTSLTEQDPVVLCQRNKPSLLKFLVASIAAMVQQTAGCSGDVPGSTKVHADVADDSGNRGVDATDGEETAGEEIEQHVFTLTVAQSPIIDSIDVEPSTLVQTCEEVTFSATAHSPDGEPIKYSWSVVEAPVGADEKSFRLSTTGDGSTATFIAEIPGKYDVALRVSNMSGGRSWNDVNNKPKQTIPIKVFAGDVKECIE